MNWISENYADLAVIYAGIVTIASIIVKLIPTLPEDHPLLPLVKWIAKFVALNQPSPTKSDRAGK